MFVCFLLRNLPSFESFPTFHVHHGVVPRFDTGFSPPNPKWFVSDFQSLSDATRSDRSVVPQLAIIKNHLVCENQNLFYEPQSCTCHHEVLDSSYSIQSEVEILANQSPH